MHPIPGATSHYDLEKAQDEIAEQIARDVRPHAA
jgi:hypothetical protein